MDFHHVAVAVHDAEPVLDLLVGEWGGTVITGERLPGFQYTVVRLGDADSGMNLEVLQPWEVETGDDFLVRFLRNRGEGPHHLSFVTDDLRMLLPQLDESITPVRVRLDWEPWQESYIMPCQGHGTVIQLAGSSIGHPPMAEMLAASRERRQIPVPIAENAVDRTWWHGLASPGPPRAYLRRVVMTTTDLPSARLLFADVLGGHVHADQGDSVEFRWAMGSRLLIEAAEVSGVSRIEVSGVDGPPTLGGIDVRLREERG